MIKTIRYDSTYLSSQIVENCFIDNKSQLIDKILCGNGFTTAYLNIKPRKSNQVNLIVVPNLGVIRSKRISYLKDLNPDKLKIAFISGDPNTDTISFEKYDVIMIVADSMLYKIDVFKDNLNLIDRVMIDEVHSVIIQSSFRYNLVGLIELINDVFKSKAIVYVTATPMLFQNIDLKLIKNKIKQRDIFVSTNQEDTLERIKTDLRNDKKVILATQDARFLKHLTDENNVLTANVRTGDTMLLKIIENLTLKFDDFSNLTIISSASFEGVDIDNGIQNIYILEDRSTEYQTFYMQNIIQIIGRARKGTNRIEWCLQQNNTRIAMISKEDMLKVANSKKISHEKKFTSSNYKFIPKYFSKNLDESLGLITDIVFNETLYDLDAEKTDADLKGLSIYDEFLNDRGFTLIYTHSGAKRMRLKGSNHKTAFENVKKNTDVIRRFDLLQDVKPNLYPMGTVNEYLKVYETFLRRKYHYVDKLVWLMDSFEYASLSVGIVNELKVYDLLKNEKEIDKQVHIITKKQLAKKKLELDKRNDIYQQWELDYKKNIKDRYIRLFIALGQEKVKLPNKIRNSRNYNLLTEVSLSLIEQVALMFNKNTIEHDIISCNSRIIYAFCGLDLPDNFYGENKINKNSINKLLNTLSIDIPKLYGKSVDNYYNYKVQKLRGYNFNEKVITFLMSTFYNKKTDAIFNFCSAIEKRIIMQLKDEIKQATKRDMNLSTIRRHDSILMFDYHSEIFEVVNKYNYYGLNNWFAKTENPNKKIEKKLKNIELEQQQMEIEWTKEYLKTLK